MYECKYGILPDGRVLVDYGPVTMSILAEQAGKAAIEAAAAGAREALRQLDILIPSLPLARRRIPDLSEEMLKDCPEILRRMAEAVRRLDRDDFTPMAAVAGTFSEMVRDHILAATKADTVVVNNGGDIALGSKDEKKEWSIGIVSDLNRRDVTHRLKLPVFRRIVYVGKIHCTTALKSHGACPSANITLIYIIIIVCIFYACITNITCSYSVIVI